MRTQIKLTEVKGSFRSRLTSAQTALMFEALRTLQGWGYSDEALAVQLSADQEEIDRLAEKLAGDHKTTPRLHPDHARTACAPLGADRGGHHVRREGRDVLRGGVLQQDKLLQGELRRHGVEHRHGCRRSDDTVGNRVGGPHPPQGCGPSTCSVRVRGGYRRACAKAGSNHPPSGERRASGTPVDEPPAHVGRVQAVLHSRSAKPADRKPSVRKVMSGRSPVRFGQRPDNSSSGMYTATIRSAPTVPRPAACSGTTFPIDPALSSHEAGSVGCRPRLAPRGTEDSCPMPNNDRLPILHDTCCTRYPSFYRATELHQLRFPHHSDSTTPTEAGWRSRRSIRRSRPVPALHAAR